MGTRRLADTYGGYRARLIEELRAKGIRDIAVLRAFGETPRHLFVPEAFERQAYEDTSLPIGNGQTISQPSTQALYLEALELSGTEKVLEIGTGSGYQTALLSFLAAHVISVERIPELAERARATLEGAGFTGVLVVTGDGSLGWRPGSPYDAILVAAVSPTVPHPLSQQLADGGKLVVPVERSGRQILLRVTKEGDRLVEQELGAVQFVPLIGRHGFTDTRERP
jgi:protein-L-isoaspartate(D-aspartate) O-methyltransferase